MASRLTLLWFCVLIASSLAADDLPETRFRHPVYVPYESAYNASLPELLVIGKIVPEFETSERERRPTVQVESVLFGPATLRSTEVDLHGFQHNDAVRIPFRECRILEIERQVEFNGTTRLLVSRIHPLAEEFAVRALAQVQLDQRVLLTDEIVVGQPREALVLRPIEEFAHEERRIRQIVVNRVLKGNAFKEGDKLDEPSKLTNRLKPAEDDAPFIYFFQNEGIKRHLIHVMGKSDINAVAAAVARCDKHPIKSSGHEFGQFNRHQEVLFLGTRSVVISLLGSNLREAQILGARRLHHEGEAAIPAVVAAIEQNLLLESSETPNQFLSQSLLIQLLGMLEKHRADGEIARLIDKMLQQAEAGANFPVPIAKPPTSKNAVAKTPPPVYGTLDTNANHSLAWLLLALPEAEACEQYLPRLLRLRDLASYGWKDEIQTAIDLGHYEDQAALAKYKRADEVRPQSWVAGYQGEWLPGLDKPIRADGLTTPSHDLSLLAILDAWEGDTYTIYDVAKQAVLGKCKRPAFSNLQYFTEDNQQLVFQVEDQFLEYWNWRTGERVRRLALPVASHLVHKIIGHRYAMIDHWLQDFTLVIDLHTGTVHHRWAKSLTKNFEQSILFHPSEKAYLAKKVSDRRWYFCETLGNRERVLPFEAEQICFSKDGATIWSIEHTMCELTPCLSLRQRRLDRDFTILAEQPLYYAAWQLTFSPDETMLIVHSPLAVRVYSTASQERIADWELPKSFKKDWAIFGLAINGKDLVAYRRYQGDVDGDSARFQEDPEYFDLLTGKLRVWPAGRRHQIQEIQYSSDGRHLMTVGSEADIRHWDAATGKPLPTEAHAAQTIPLLGPSRSLWSAHQGDDYGDGWEDQRNRVAEEERQFGIEGVLPDERKRHWTFTATLFTYDQPVPNAWKVYFSRDTKVSRQQANESIRDMGEYIDSVQPLWGQTGPIGLVPGGRYFHIGTNIYTRRGFKLVTAPNLAGDFSQMVFSPNGLQYALVTKDADAESHRFLTLRDQKRRPAKQRVRIHDTLTGEMLMAITPERPIRLMTIAPDGNSFATVNDEQVIEVWPITAEPVR